VRNLVATLANNGGSTIESVAKHLARVPQRLPGRNSITVFRGSDGAHHGDVSDGSVDSAAAIIPDVR
jgi:hypothetical protein